MASLAKWFSVLYKLSGSGFESSCSHPTFVVICEPSHGFSDYNTSLLASIICHPQKIILVQRTIPTKRFSEPWLNQECKRAVQKNVRQYQVLTQAKKQEGWLKFQEAGNAVSTLNNTYSSYMKQNFTENDDSKKKKKFHSFTKAKRSDILGVSPLVQSEGVTQILMIKKLL